MRKVDVAAGLLFAAFGAGVVVEAASIPPMIGQAYGPGFFPSLVGGGLVVAGLIIALRGLFTAPEAVAEGAGPPAPTAARPYWGALAWLVAGLVVIIQAFEAIGFVPLLGTYLAGFMLLLGVRPVQAVVLGFLLTLGVYFLFVRLLLVPLPAGLLQPLLG